MTVPSDAGPTPPPRDAYSPQLRTALVFTGSGTAGAYHAGVLQALQEAGVKIDVVAGTGVGVASALFAAIDGGARLSDRDGLWRQHAVRRFYRVRPALRFAAWGLAGAWAVALIPFAVLALGLLVYPAGFVLGLAGGTSGTSLARAYTSFVQTVFDPAFLPSILSRALLVSLTAFLGLLAVLAGLVLVAGRHQRRDRAPVWWRVAGAPLSASEVVGAVSLALWRLLGGAAGARQPTHLDLSRAYAELLRDNLGQPGFREVLLTVHDLDVRRDFVFAMLTERYRRDFFRAPGQPGTDRRVAELFDLAGVARDHLMDLLSAALRLPLGTEPQLLGFPAESYWCGERHRAVERPGAFDRLLHELPAAGVEQVILVSAFPEIEGPHRLRVPRGDWRGRIGELLAGAEAAAVREAARSDGRFRCLFLVRPSYNPLGPLDLDGCFDERSERRIDIGELVDRGYEDAYRQFIDPVVGASGERLESTSLRVRT